LRDLMPSYNPGLVTVGVTRPPNLSKIIAHKLGFVKPKKTSRDPFMLSEKAKAKIEQLKGKYPDPKSALLPALEIAQREHGWLSEEVMREVSQAMDLPPTEVASVASFYTMLYTQPMGEHVIQVCTNISCSLLGAEHLVDYLSRKLGIEVGDTTPDGKFTLLTVECLGSCGTAPMMQVDETYHENLTEEKIERILAELV
jgi:NADH-quinone oxidoreductase subunit E